MHNLVSDNGDALDALIVCFSNLVSDTGYANDSLQSIYDQIAQLADSLIATDLADSLLSAKNLIIEAATAHDSLVRVWPVSLADAVFGHDLATAMLAANTQLVDNAIAHTSADFVLNFTFAVTDDALASDGVTSQLSAFELLQDGAKAVVSFSLNGESFTGVVLNADTSGVSEYTNFPFNSFAKFNGKYYGCADDGLYSLEGDTDNGETIQGKVRTGLIRMSDGLRTRFPSAYIGYTSSGDVVMKVVTTSPQGQKIENWYKLEKRTADSMRETRVKIGRGLSSVYWQFELINVKGSDFEVDSVQLMPMPLERRI